MVHHLSILFVCDLLERLRSRKEQDLEYYNISTHLTHGLLSFNKALKCREVHIPMTPFLESRVLSKFKHESTGYKDHSDRWVVEQNLWPVPLYWDSSKPNFPRWEVMGDSKMACCKIIVINYFVLSRIRFSLRLANWVQISTRCNIVNLRSNPTRCSRVYRVLPIVFLLFGLAPSLFKVVCYHRYVIGNQYKHCDWPIRVSAPNSTFIKSAGIFQR